MQNETLSDQLKTETSGPHQELEKVLIQRMRKMQNVDDYVDLLKCFYSYFGALEDQINLYIGVAELPDHLQRRKSESLVADIHSLGGSLPEKANPADLPAIKNRLQAFGAMYVMEGSTLGGLIISRMIGKQLDLHEAGLSFFQSYGEQLHTMWDSFKLALNQQAEDQAESSIVLTAAEATFRQFKVILDRTEF